MNIKAIALRSLIIFSTITSIVPPASNAIGADWPDTQTIGPFIFRADFSLRTINPFLNELSQLQNDLVQSLDIPTAQEPIEVYLFHDQKTYNSYLKKHFPNIPFRRAIYIKAQGPGRVFAYRSEQFEIDLRHECTHALLHASLKNIPLWLDEGLAGYYELPTKQRIAGSPHLSSVRWSVWLGKPPKIENLEKCIDIANMGKTEYRDSWAWVYFMLHGSTEAHRQLVLYLSDMQKNDSQVLLSERLKHNVPTLQQNFSTYFNNWKTTELTKL